MLVLKTVDKEGEGEREGESQRRAGGNEGGKVGKKEKRDQDYSEVSQCIGMNHK